MRWPFLFKIACMKMPVRFLLLDCAALLISVLVLGCTNKGTPTGTPVPATNSQTSIPVVISRSPRLLSNKEVEDLVSGEFRIVSKIQEIPAVVKDSFINFVDWGAEGRFAVLEQSKKAEALKTYHLSLDMADPGQRMNQDFIEPGVPNRRLVLCGYSESAAIVLYEQGGYVETKRLVVFKFGQNPGAWQAVLRDETASLVEIKTDLHQRLYTVEIPTPPVKNPG